MSINAITSIFRCSACGAALPELGPLPDWAHWQAFPCASFSSEPPPSNEAHFQRLENLPDPGSVQWLSVTQHFGRPQPGGSVWVLFMPPLSEANGWDDQPEELALSGLVRVELVEMLSKQEREAWLSVRVLEVHRLTELSGLWPPHSHPAPLPEMLAYGPRACVQCGDLAYCWANGEGDVFEAVLCQRRAGRWSLLMHWESCFHNDCLHVGHRPLSAAESASLGLPEITL